ncbi:MAG: virulence protein [Clostridia bacterium]|nr:virulence protein [Clostridia bacterium]
MTFKYNVTGAKRKELVNAISELTEAPVKYLGAPSFAYEVDYFTIDKNGGVTFDDRADSEEIEMLVEALLEQGFEPEDTENGEEAYGLVVSISRDAAPDAAIENLKRMLQTKGALIKKAVGADNTDLEVDDTVIRFPWFDTMPDPGMVGAVSKLIGKMLAAAKTKKRIVVKKEYAEPENEKYAFRCYLLSLGFIGSEYKNERKTLLRNLEGNGSFKSGARKEPAAPIEECADTMADYCEALADELLIQEVNDSFESEDTDEQ